MAVLVFFSTPSYTDELVDPETCKYLVAAEPAPDVAYQPGVDVHGKPVVEADLTPPVVTMPENFSFDVTVDLARKIGLQTPPGTEMTMKVGTVTYDKGHLLFNGNPMEGEAEANLRALCAHQEAPSK